MENEKKELSSVEKIILDKNLVAKIQEKTKELIVEKELLRQFYAQRSADFIGKSDNKSKEFAMRENEERSSLKFLNDFLEFIIKNNN